MPSSKMRRSPPSGGKPKRANSCAASSGRRRRRSSVRARLAARRAELQRSIDTAAQQRAIDQQSVESLHAELERLADASADAGLQAALALKLEREAALAAQRSDYDDLSLRLRRADEQRHGRTSKACSRCATRSPACNSKSRRRSSAARSIWSSWPPPKSTSHALAQGIASRRRQLSRAAGRDRPHQSRDRCARRGQPGGARRTDRIARAQGLPRRAERRPERGDRDAGRCDPQDRPGDARAARRHLQPGQRTFRPHVPEPVRRRQCAAGDDGRRDPRCRRAGDGAAAGQEEQHHPPAVGRRKGA